MPRSPQNDLFLLVQSLQTDEKQYVRKYLRRGQFDGPSHGEVLLDALLDQEEYDEQELKGALPPAIAGNLSYEKHRLMDTLVQALRRYLESKREDLAARNLIAEARIFIERGLFGASGKKLKKARKIALEHELHLLLAEVNLLERQLAKRTLRPADHQKLEALEDEGKQLLKQLEDEFSYRSLADQIFRAYRSKTKPRQEDEKEEVISWDQDPLLQAEPKEGTFESRKLYFISLATISHFKEDKFEFRDRYRDVVHLWSQYSALQQSRRSDYKINLMNYLQACHAAQDYAPFPAVLEQLRALPPKSENERLEDWSGILGTEFLGAINTLNFKRAEELVPELEWGLGKYKNRLPQSRYINTYFNIGIFYFVTNRPKQALFAIAPILDIPRCAQKADICHFCRVFEIILYFESGQQRFLDRFFQVNFNRLKRTGNLFPFERTVLKRLQKMDPVGHSLNRDRFRVLYEELVALGEKSSSKPRGFDEVKLWVESKVRGKSMEEVLRDWGR